MKIISEMYSFKGEYTRKQFWKAIIALLIKLFSTIALVTLYYNYYGPDMSHRDFVEKIDEASTVITIIAIYPILAIHVKRLRQLNQNTWHAVWSIIPIAGFVLFIYSGFARNPADVRK